MLLRRRVTLHGTWWIVSYVILALTVLFLVIGLLAVLIRLNDLSDSNEKRENHERQEL